MILNILRKDWKLLWPIVALVAVLHVLVEWARYGEGLFGESGAVDLLETVAIIGWVVLVTAVVHQDTIPGSTQDWLIRPIKRRDLLLAKLLFLVLMLHGPLFLANVIDAVAQGFPLQDSLAAAVRRGAALFLAYTLLVFALAAATGNMTELLLAGIVAAVLIAASQGIFMVRCGPTCGAGFAWVVGFAVILFAAAAACVVLGLQYFKRNATWWSRGVIAVGVVSVTAIGALAAEFAFEIQRALSPKTNVADRVAIELDRTAAPGERKGRDPSAMPDQEQSIVLAARSSLAGSSSSSERRYQLRQEAEGTTISLPLGISGMPTGMVLWADRVAVRLVDASGRVVFQGAGDELEVRATPGRAQVDQTVLIRPDIYDLYRDRDLRVEIDYELTLLGPEHAIGVPAAQGEAVPSSDTKCGTRLPRNASSIEFRCQTVNRVPSCFTAALEHESSGDRNREFLVCRPDYMPFRQGPELFRRYGIDVPFAAGEQAEDPVGAADLDEAQVRFETYEARAHFARQLVVPRLKLVDWTLAN